MANIKKITLQRIMAMVNPPTMRIFHVPIKVSGIIKVIVQGIEHQFTYNKNTRYIHVKTRATSITVHYYE